MLVRMPSDASAPKVSDGKSVSLELEVVGVQVRHDCVPGPTPRSAVYVNSTP